MNETATDEIDLIELIGTLWDAKWLIGAITLGFSVLSIGVALLLPASFEGQLRITALTNQQMAAYQTLNNTPGISDPVYAGEVLVGQEGVVLSEELFKAFQEEMRRGRVFGEAHQALDPDVRDFDGTREEKTRMLAKIGRGYTFTLDKGSKTSGVLSFGTSERDLGLAIVQLALNETNQIIRRDNLAAIADLRRSIETSLKFEIDEVTMATENALADYQIIIAAHRARLKEHAAIARQLGIADHQPGATAQVGIDISIENAISQPTQGRGLLYLRGYKALEKEIALIDARGKGAAAYPFIDGYAALAARLRELQSDKRLERIETGLALTPLADTDGFRAFNFDLETVIFEPTIAKRLIVILVTLMGGLLAVIFVLIRNALVTRQEQAAA